LIALAVKLRLAATTVGTNDVLYWSIFAGRALRSGCFAIYGELQIFNHPPIVCP
jgi:hypothetical protein